MYQHSLFTLANTCSRHEVLMMYVKLLWLWTCQFWSAIRFCCRSVVDVSHWRQSWNYWNVQWK